MIPTAKHHPQIKTWQEGRTFHIDVREFLKSGGQPYTYIMDCLIQLDAGDVLAVHAPFEPKPLIRQAKQAGFLTVIHQDSPEHWVLDITRGS